MFKKLQLSLIVIATLCKWHFRLTCPQPPADDFVTTAAVEFDRQQDVTLEQKKRHTGVMRKRAIRAGT